MCDLGVDSFVLSGYPHLEESIRFAELVFPLLGKQAVTDSARAQTGGAFDIRGVQQLKVSASWPRVIDMRCRPAFLHDFSVPRPARPNTPRHAGSTGAWARVATST
jgi:hypothetical protein